eukprot:TRINITY_DN1750_c0_g3_i1.p1 TRINITY_DN1750_c0_g3~~TRINITY_DN1750_c0_g3_i1.p1  ORF type:complete len:1276 (-),score=493.80 TRINITY_DN1750_c0_g3_i1:71-3898(-)
MGIVPSEVWSNIASFLPMESIVDLTETCHHLKTMFRDLVTVDSTGESIYKMFKRCYRHRRCAYGEDGKTWSPEICNQEPKDIQTLLFNSDPPDEELTHGEFTELLEYQKGAGKHQAISDRVDYAFWVLRKGNVDNSPLNWEHIIRRFKNIDLTLLANELGIPVKFQKEDIHTLLRTGDIQTAMNLMQEVRDMTFDSMDMEFAHQKASFDVMLELHDMGVAWHADSVYTIAKRFGINAVDTVIERYNLEVGTSVMAAAADSGNISLLKEGNNRNYPFPSDMLLRSVKNASADFIHMLARCKHSIEGVTALAIEHDRPDILTWAIDFDPLPEHVDLQSMSLDLKRAFADLVRENKASVPWSRANLMFSLQSGLIEFILQHQNDINWGDDDILECVHDDKIDLETIEMLHEHGCPLHEGLINAAFEHKDLDLVCTFLKMGCPVPDFCLCDTERVNLATPKEWKYGLDSDSEQKDLTQSILGVLLSNGAVIPYHFFVLKAYRTMTMQVIKAIDPIDRYWSPFFLSTLEKVPKTEIPKIRTLYREDGTNHDVDFIHDIPTMKMIKNSDSGSYEKTTTYTLQLLDEDGQTLSDEDDDGQADQINQWISNKDWKALKTGIDLTKSINWNSVAKNLFYKHESNEKKGGFYRNVYFGGRWRDRYYPATLGPTKTTDYASKMTKGALASLFKAASIQGASDFLIYTLMFAKKWKVVEKVLGNEQDVKEEKVISALINADNSSYLEGLLKARAKAADTELTDLVEAAKSSNVGFNKFLRFLELANIASDEDTVLKGLQMGKYSFVAADAQMKFLKANKPKFMALFAEMPDLVEKRTTNGHVKNILKSLGKPTKEACITAAQNLNIAFIEFALDKKCANHMDAIVEAAAASDHKLQARGEFIETLMRRFDAQLTEDAIYSLFPTSDSSRGSIAKGGLTAWIEEVFASLPDWKNQWPGIVTSVVVTEMARKLGKPSKKMIDSWIANQIPALIYYTVELGVVNKKQQAAAIKSFINLDDKDSEDAKFILGFIDTEAFAEKKSDILVALMECKWVNELDEATVEDVLQACEPMDDDAIKAVAAKGNRALVRHVAKRSKQSLQEISDMVVQHKNYEGFIGAWEGGMKLDDQNVGMLNKTPYTVFAALPTKQRTKLKKEVEKLTTYSKSSIITRIDTKPIKATQSQIVTWFRTNNTSAVRNAYHSGLLTPEVVQAMWDYAEENGWDYKRNAMHVMKDLGFPGWKCSCCCGMNYPRPPDSHPGFVPYHRKSYGYDRYDRYGGYDSWDEDERYW